MLQRFLIFISISFVFLFAKEPINSLINEESPYLQQHAHNPVNWLAWGKRAFDKAKRENKLIFLSIGYSTCHWCHVMERESFENSQVAKILNQYFVAIKVDREEYPQIDHYYQKIYQLLNHQAGGWPLTLILTPDLKPFFATTYIPRESRYNQLGLLELLNKAQKAWRESSKNIKKIANSIDKAIKQRENLNSLSSSLAHNEILAKKFVLNLKRSFDQEFGGWGSEPKFPRATTLIALLQIYRLTYNHQALFMADKTLKAMAMGGIYDQVEGGFFRYSTDKRWQIPHFEKMLYTNAELLEAYSLGAIITKEILYKRVVDETIAMLQANYKDPSGLFYGASDADSIDPKSKEKVEGFYYTYKYDRVFKALKRAGVKEIDKALKECGITKNGNFIRFRSQAHLLKDRSCLLDVRQVLRDIRSTRPYPFIDHKLQASWNALLIHSLFVASKLNSKYEILALNTIKALKKELYINGILYHQKLPNHSPKVRGLLEDYSFVIACALDAYEASQDISWLNWAKELFEYTKKHFYSNGIWYDAQGEFKNALSLEGGAYRSSLGVLVDDMLRLAILSSKMDYQEMAVEILIKNSQPLYNYPQALPMGVLAWLAKYYGYVELKIPSKEFPKLKQKFSLTLPYPFLIFKKSKEDLFQACRIDRCFLDSRDERAFFKALKESLSPEH